MTKKLRQISTHPEKCAHCLSCQLICSLTFTKAFNPSRARLSVGGDEGIFFLPECNGCGLCASYCVYGALEMPQEQIEKAGVVSG